MEHSVLHGQRVLILGLGASGLSMARWCTRQGASVTVADTREHPPQLAALKASLPQVDFVQSDMDSALVAGSEFRAVFKSPGLKPVACQGAMDAARAIGIWVGSELSLFALALKALNASQQYTPKILAITGTNGKTTVTSLTRHLVAWSGKSVEMAGNIGPPLLDTLSQALDAQKLPEVWVLELSSFQLEIPTELECTAATVLNVTQDHLDWHASMAEYAAAKAHIFGGKSLMVLNRDDAAVMAMLPEPQKGIAPRNWTSFGSGMPQRPSEFGIEDINGMVWLVRALEADETRRRKKDDVPELHHQRLMPVDALRIRGRHNACNALAALALCAAAGCPLATILFGLREYRGEPHRVQSIGILDGVEFFDDSKGTNVGATVAAIAGLGADRKLVLLLGGDGKGQDFAPLAEPIAQHARAVVLIGRDAGLIRAALADTGVPLLDATTMEHAVMLAQKRAHVGDAVLLSPACASLDMFDHYVHRGQVFQQAVQDLALSVGVQLEGAA